MTIHPVGKIMWSFKVALIPLLILRGVLPGVGQAEICLTNNPSDDRYASYSPDGRLILFESNRDGNWDVFTMLPDGSDQKRLTHHIADDRSPSWHPDGLHVLFESNRTGKTALYLLHLKTGKTKQITSNQNEGEWTFASFSPSGKRIAASFTESEEKSNILILNTKGKIVQAITRSNTRSYYPRWSADGKEIVYFSRKETNNRIDEIFIYGMVTRTERKLSNTQNNAFCPSWSPDGQQIAYVASMDSTRPEIFLIRADNGFIKQITRNDDGETLPSWSPDGTHLLVTAFRNGNFEICKLALTK